MPSRPYKCPVCHSAFRNESGMKWHLAHRHEVPGAVDALDKKYETKIVGLQDENTLLKQKLERAESELSTFKLNFNEAIEAMTKYSAEMLRYHNIYTKEIITSVHEGLEDAVKKLFGT